MICTGCKLDKPIKARGMCAACYTHWQKYGTTERVRMRRGQCTVEGCENPAHGRGMCHTHLKRLRVSGTTADPRANQAPPPSHHPLYPQWVEFNRAKNARPVVDRWKEDFAVFVAEVGERPSKRHRLYQRDRDQPLGPGNFVWRHALVERQQDETQQEYNKRYRRAHKDAYGTDYHDGGLRLKYGADFGLREYLAMFEAQGGKCAVCKQDEVEAKHGKVKALAVDHDHVTGAVRGLLCSACNTGLGKFRDNAELLLTAAAYLKSFAPQQA